MGRSLRTARQPVRRQPERDRADLEQLVVHAPHGVREVSARRLERWHLGRPRVREEPLAIDGRVTRLELPTDRVALFEIGERRIAYLAVVVVRLEALRNPAPTADGRRVPLLGLIRQGEKGPCGSPNRLTRARGIAVAAPQQEAGCAERRIDLRRESASVSLGTMAPDLGDRRGESSRPSRERYGPVGGPGLRPRKACCDPRALR